MIYTPTSDWMRNYGAMGDKKLMSAVKDFRVYANQDFYTMPAAVQRVVDNGGVIDDNRAKCEYEARRRGLIDDSFVPDGTDVVTERKFCPECEKTRPFLLDDYICRDCREAM